MMTPTLKTFFVCTALLLLPACRDAQPTALDDRVRPVRVVSEIQDAPRSSLAAGFFWLPPMVSAPGYTGTFDGSLAPVVEVCRPLGGGCALPLVARFTTADRGSDRVRVDPGEQHYIVNWHTRESSLDPAQIYRVRVQVGGTQLGYADLKLVKNGSEAKQVDESRYVPVVMGRTLPIKFRIEQGAVPAPGPTRFVTAAAAGVQDRIGPDGGVLSTTFGGIRYTLSVPAGALADPKTITMTPLARAHRFPLSGGLAAGVSFAPDGLTFLTPAKLVIELPPGSSAAGLVAFGFEGAGDSFRLDFSTLAGSSVSIPVSHFSGNGVADASDADVSALVPTGSVQSEAQALSALGALERAARLAGGFAASQFNEAARILAEWYSNVVAPALAAATNTDAALDSGLRAYLTWLNAVQRLGLDLSSQDQQARGLARAALQAGIDRAAAECQANNDMDALVRALRWQGVAQLLGLDVTGPRCVSVEIQSLEFPQRPVAGESATLRVVARVLRADGGHLDSWQARVRVTPAGATDNSVREGVVDDVGAFSASFVPADDAREIRLTVRACVESADARLRQICADALVARGLGVVVQVQPEAVRVGTNATAQFSAQVMGARNTDVTWSATGGSISPAGLYTAGSTPGSYFVVATSAADPSKSDTATVTVVGSAGAWQGMVRLTVNDLEDQESHTYDYPGTLELTGPNTGSLTYYDHRVNGYGDRYSYWYIHHFRDGVVYGIQSCNDRWAWGSSFCATPLPPPYPHTVSISVSGSTASARIQGTGPGVQTLYDFTSR